MFWEVIIIELYDGLNKIFLHLNSPFSLFFKFPSLVKLPFSVLVVFYLLDPRSRERKPTRRLCWDTVSLWWVQLFSVQEWPELFWNQMFWINLEECSNQGCVLEIWEGGSKNGFRWIVSLCSGCVFISINIRFIKWFKVYILTLSLKKTYF